MSNSLSNIVIEQSGDAYNGMFKIIADEGYSVVNGFDPSSQYCGAIIVDGNQHIPVPKTTLLSTFWGQWSYAVGNGTWYQQVMGAGVIFLCCNLVDGVLVPHITSHNASSSPLAAGWTNSMWDDRGSYGGNSYGVAANSASSWVIPIGLFYGGICQLYQGSAIHVIGRCANNAFLQP